MEQMKTEGAHPVEEQTEDPYCEEALESQVKKHSWEDIDCLPPSQIPTYLLSVAIPKEYQPAYHRFSHLARTNQKSQRSLDLSSLLLSIDSGNYYALMLRRACWQQGAVSPEKEIKFLSHLLTVDSKSYQLWTYRREISKAISFVGEEEYIDSLLEDDLNNYHVWSHRIWLTSTVGNFEKEWVRMEHKLLGNFRFLECNSYWNYRMFLLRGMGRIGSQDFVEGEVKKMMELVREKPAAESVWNYVNGFFNGDFQREQKYLYKNFPEIKETCDGIPNRFSQYTLLLISKEEGNQEKTTRLLNQLALSDPTRLKYWQHLLPSTNE